MGKASKWIRNLLMSKKEDKKKNDTTFSIEYHTSETQDETPKVRRKWSFRKFAGRDPNFKLSSSNSFESADTPKLRPQVFLESTKSQQKHHTSLAVTSRDDKNAAAATKIQAVFRSFLARKALHALKGLVKLQALFRGHLVRKQTASTLRGMHALMAIQVRARVQRIQLAEETESSIKTQSSSQNTITQESKVKDVHQRPKNNYKNETRSPVSKSTSGYLNHYEINKKDAMSHSGPLSISKQHQYEESCFTAAGKSPLNYPSTMIKTKSTGASMIQKHPNCAERMSYYNYLLLPNYMAKTESSRAKVRSQSEPKQRPKESKKQKSKHIETTDGVHAFLEDQVLETSTSKFKFNGVENYDPFFKKLYRNGKSLEDNKYDSISTITSQSNYYEYLATHEANWSIY